MSRVLLVCDTIKEIKLDARLRSVKMGGKDGDDGEQFLVVPSSS
jgi:hypothetical protein